MNKVDMKPIKSALQNIGDDEPEFQKALCVELASRFNDVLVPMGIGMACALFMHDLLKGKSGFSGKPLPQKLIGYPAMAYSTGLMLARQIIIDASPVDARTQISAALNA